MGTRLSDDAKGQIFALLAAITWALALVFFRKSGASVPPLAMNLFKNCVAIVLLAITLALTGDGLAPLAAFPAADYYILALSGFLGIALADTVFFYSLNRIGVGMFAIVDCSYSPSVLLASWLILGEHLSPWHYAGGAMIIAGILIASARPVQGISSRTFLTGIGLGLASIWMMAIGVVYAKLVLDVNGFPLIWATAIRLVVGTAALWAIVLASPQRHAVLSVFRSGAIWRYTVPASILGTYLSMIFWLAGFKYTHASVAAVLNQTSAFFAMLLAAMLLGEPLTKRRVAALLLAMAGVVTVTLWKSMDAWLARVLAIAGLA